MPILPVLALMANPPDWTAVPSQTPRSMAPAATAPTATPAASGAPVAAAPSGFGRSPILAAGQNNVAAVQDVVNALARGDGAPLAAIFQDSATWRAGGKRALPSGVTQPALLDRRGAQSFAAKMAEGIRGGSQQLRVVSVQAQGNDVLVTTQWSNGNICRNLVRLTAGRIVEIVAVA